MSNEELLEQLESVDCSVRVALGVSRSIHNRIRSFDRSYCSFIHLRLASQPWHVIGSSPTHTSNHQVYADSTHAYYRMHECHLGIQ